MRGPVQESRHNLVYWRYGEYAGVGPGAHGRVNVAGTRFATVTEKSPEGWLSRVTQDGSALTENTSVDDRARAEEALLMGMRLTEGFDLKRLDDFAGLSVPATTLDALARHGLIERLGGSVIRATPSGRLVLNRLVFEIYAAMSPGAA